MTLLNKKWHINQPDPEGISRIRGSFGLSRPIAQVVCNRDIPSEDVLNYFQPRLDLLSDPLTIPGMPDAVERIWQAVRKGERILIHGDFDTDGITATALLSWVLRENGAAVDCYLPHRIDDGYGLSPESLSKGITDHRLVVSVDCGITSIEGAAYAKEQGVDLIITDHHEPDEELPEAYAIVNPKLNPELKSLQVLAGVGVCFKVCHAFLKYGRQHDYGGYNPDLKDGMDLLALGTVADIVPLTGENRTLVKFGMRVLGAQRRPGIHALCGIAGVRDVLRTEDIAFRLAPRLNAAGRMGDAEEALALLQSESVVEAHELARQLDQYNRLRQDQEENTYRAARQQIEESSRNDQHALVVCGEDWHRGVIGIVASRLAQEFNRPSIVLTLDKNVGMLHGSGRSIPGVNLIETLDLCRGYLDRFGGHPMAVGLAMDPEQYEEFASDFDLAIRAACDESANFVPTLELDGIVRLGELDETFFSELEMLQPFGHSNPPPLFQFNKLMAPRVLKAGKNNARGTLYDRDGSSINFICFGHRPDQLPPSPWDVVAVPEMNVYNNRSTPQLQIRDIRSAEFHRGEAPATT